MAEGRFLALLADLKALGERLSGLSRSLQAHQGILTASIRGYLALLWCLEVLCKCLGAILKHLVINISILRAFLVDSGLLFFHITVDLRRQIYDFLSC